MLESVSIVIPCFNEEYYIDKLLVSLANQTYLCFEIIIVDGGSTDRTRDVISEVVHTHSHLQNKVSVYLSDKRGVAYQRNYGAARARYERLLFLDADVQVRSRFLELTLSEIAKKGLQLATVEFEPLSTRVDDKLLYFIGNLYVKVQQFIEPVAMGVCIFSTKTVHALLGGFDETLKLAEDYDYVSRAAQRGIMLKVLKKGKVYISVRRLNDEGRFNYYKKAVLSEVYRLLQDRESCDSIEYDFGKFSKHIEEPHFDIYEKDKAELWKKLLQALTIERKG